MSQGGNWWSKALKPVKVSTQLTRHRRGTEASQSTAGVMSRQQIEAFPVVWFIRFRKVCLASNISRSLGHARRGTDFRTSELSDVG